MDWLVKKRMFIKVLQGKKRTFCYVLRYQITNIRTRKNISFISFSLFFLTIYHPFGLVYYVLHCILIFVSKNELDIYILERSEYNVITLPNLNYAQ